MTEIQKKIVSSATNWITATALAKSVGKSKGAQIQNDIDVLVESGDLEKNTDGRFTVYKKNKKSTVNVTKNADTNIVDEDIINAKEDSLPEGYIASNPVIRKSTSQKGRIITIPKGSRVFVEDGYSLVVINGEAVKCVKTPISAIAEIQKYAEQHNIANFTVSQLQHGTIGNSTDITSYGGVIDLQITKNNKPA